jgi:hypothetical protein
MILDKNLAETLRQVVRDSMKRKLGQFLAQRFIKKEQLIDPNKFVQGYKLRYKSVKDGEYLNTNQLANLCN